MTVAELIKELEKMPQDYDILYMSDSNETYKPECEICNMIRNDRKKIIGLY
jgi:hypothetical protein